MSGRVRGVGGNPPVVVPIRRSRSLAEDMPAYLRFGYRSVKPGNQDRIINFLRYEPGDSELVQDIKDLVIRRIACEAYSRNDLEVSEAFSALLDDFPRPPLMRDYMIPEPHKLGQPVKIIEACRPQPGDSPFILRAKRSGLLFNIMKVILELHVPIMGIMNYRCSKADFDLYYGWMADFMREHVPHMPLELAQLVDVHILQPELPFNIELPD